jgi:hypothetical protein
LPRGARIERVLRFDERFTRLWASFASDVGVGVERDDRYLRWRLLDKPGEAYTNLALLRGDDLVAFVSFTVKEKHGGRIGYVMDLLHEPGEHRAARVLLSRAVADMRDAGADAVLAWCFSHSPNHRSHLRCGFLPFPARFRPIELHMGVRPFDRAVASTVLDRTRWYASYLDSDTV